MTTPDNTNEPADLSELTATDALLDRLGHRNASEHDLLDPTAAVLADLVAVIDQSREPDVDAARLIEVLAGRPLYIAGAEPAIGETALMIDLTEHEDGSDDNDSTEDDDQKATGSGESLVPVTRLPPAVVPIRVPVLQPAGPQRWERALSHISLPAASVLLLIAVGGGVSAAVTGNPMTPVNGITRVMAQLPGVSDGSLDQIRSEISAARSAADKKNAPLAYAHLDKAQAILDDLPDSDKPNLNQQIEALRVLLPSTISPTVPGLPGSVVSAGPGSVPEIAASPSAPDSLPSASTTPPVEATKSPDAVEPSADPGPTTAPSAADPAPSTQAAAAEPTPAAATSSP